MTTALIFKKGIKSNLPEVVDGQILYTTDEQTLYIDDNGQHNQINANHANYANIAGEANYIKTSNIFHGNDELMLSTIIENYILNINYDRTLKFDVTELVISGGATSSILDVGMLDYMVLA